MLNGSSTQHSMIAPLHRACNLILSLVLMTSCTPLTEELVTTAQQQATQKNYLAAIQTLRKIPANSKEYLQAQENISTYKVALIPPQVQQQVLFIIEALITLQTRLQTPISYDEYRDLTRQLSADVQQLELAEQAIQHPAYVGIKLAVTDYKLALDWWECFEETEPPATALPLDQCGGSLVVQRYGLLTDTSTLTLSQALSAIWAKASLHQREARDGWRVFECPGPACDKVPKVQATQNTQDGKEE